MISLIFQRIIKKTALITSFKVKQILTRPGQGGEPFILALKQIYYYKKSHLLCSMFKQTILY